MGSSDDAGYAEDSVQESATFLGGLRSELDEGSHLHPTFSSMAAAADAVRASYLRFDITPSRAAEAFRLLRIIDDNEIEWTIGPSSGGWFRRRIGSPNWQAALPPLMAEPKSGSAVPWLSHELADMLPAARAMDQADESRSRAGIRVVDSSEITVVDEGEARDWLLQEWEDLETHINTIQDQNRAAREAEARELALDVQARAEASQAAVNEDLGLPDAPEPDPADDMFDLFVPPEARVDAVTLEDILESGPADRSDADRVVPLTPSSPHQADGTYERAPGPSAPDADTAESSLNAQTDTTVDPYGTDDPYGPDR